MKINIIALIVIIFFLLTLPQVASTEHRIALVIGNGAYSSDPLSDPPNDAKLMANILRSIDFEVLEYKDLNQQRMKEQIRNFGKRLKARKDSVGVFYYSGHGMQVEGKNYMIPVGVPIEDESDIEINGVGILEVLTRMRFAGNNMNFMFLDACRDNPFEKSFKSAAKGLSRIDAPKGTLIAYAAQPNKVARQGPGEYSYFTEALAQEIVKPGISVRDMLLNVRKIVHDRTAEQQVPVVEDQMLAKFYFNPKKEGQVREIDRDGHLIAYNNGVVKDTLTGLEWVAGPDRRTSWEEARTWAQELAVDGGGWRMPTIEELRTLHQWGAGTRNMSPLLKTTGYEVWSKKTRDSSAWYFDFNYGNEYLHALRYKSNKRGFAVRYHK